MFKTWSALGLSSGENAQDVQEIPCVGTLWPLVGERQNAPDVPTSSALYEPSERNADVLPTSSAWYAPTERNALDLQTSSAL